MTVAFCVLQRCFRKYLVHINVVEKRDAENLQDFDEFAVNIEFLFHDGHEHVYADGDPDLCGEGVERRAEERLDAQVLLDPFEEQLDLPAVLVKVGDGERREREVVGEKHESFARLGVDVADAAIPSIPADTLVELEPGHKVEQLSEDDSSRVHRPPLSTLLKKKGRSVRPSSNRKQSFYAITY